MSKATRHAALRTCLLVLAVACGAAACRLGGERSLGDDALAARSEPPAAPIRTSTLLPRRFDGRASSRPLPNTLLLPQSLIAESQVISSHAEVRLGPGTQFGIRDQLLTAGTHVIVTEAVGAWRKVFTLGGEPATSGWLHRQMLAPVGANRRALPVATKHLPLVIAIRPITSLYTYPERNHKTVAIPKGSTFIALKKTKRRMLVWIAETNSPAWLANNDIR